MNPLNATQFAPHLFQRLALSAGVSQDSGPDLNIGHQISSMSALSFAKAIADTPETPFRTADEVSLDQVLAFKEAVLTYDRQTSLTRRAAKFIENSQFPNIDPEQSFTIQEKQAAQYMIDLMTQLNYDDERPQFDQEQMQVVHNLFDRSRPFLKSILDLAFAEDFTEQLLYTVYLFTSAGPYREAPELAILAEYDPTPYLDPTDYEVLAMLAARFNPKAIERIIRGVEEGDPLAKTALLTSLHGSPDTARFASSNTDSYTPVITAIASSLRRHNPHMIELFSSHPFKDAFINAGFSQETAPSGRPQDYSDLWYTSLNIIIHEYATTNKDFAFALFGDLKILERLLAELDDHIQNAERVNYNSFSSILCDKNDGPAQGLLESLLDTEKNASDQVRKVIREQLGENDFSYVLHRLKALQP